MFLSFLGSTSIIDVIIADWIVVGALALVLGLKDF
jgi:hypothetical protein